MPDKKEKRLQDNFFKRLVRGIQKNFRETVGELRKVSWPTRTEALNLTLIVLIVIAGMTIFLGVLDYIYANIFRLLLSVGG